MDFNHHSITLGSTPRPLVGQLIEIPKGVTVPMVYIDQRRRTMPVREGFIVEEYQDGGVLVSFFGYPHDWHYPYEVAATFLLPKTLIGPSMGYLPTPIE